MITSLPNVGFTCSNGTTITVKPKHDNIEGHPSGEEDNEGVEVPVGELKDKVMVFWSVVAAVVSATGVMVWEIFHIQEGGGGKEEKVGRDKLE